MPALFLNRPTTFQPEGIGWLSATSRRNPSTIQLGFSRIFIRNEPPLQENLLIFFVILSPGLPYSIRLATQKCRDIKIIQVRLSRRIGLNLHRR